MICVFDYCICFVVVAVVGVLTTVLKKKVGNRKA